MLIGLVGASSLIAQELASQTSDPVVEGHFDEMPLDLHRYLICCGYLAGRALSEMTDEESARTWDLNFFQPARFCDRLFAANHRARVCVIGSESGFSGSFDMAYAGAKAALHLYVETKRLLHAEQMLIALAPHIIWDTGMTQRRPDTEVLALRCGGNRLGRWLTAGEVAREAHHLLFRASASLSGTIVRMRAQ